MQDVTGTDKYMTLEELTALSQLETC